MAGKTVKRSDINRSLNIATGIRVEIPSNSGLLTTPAYQLATGQLQVEATLKFYLQNTVGDAVGDFSTTQGDIKLKLEPRAMMPANNAAGQVVVYARVVGRPEDDTLVVPEVAEEFADLDFQRVNAYDGSAIVKGSALMFVLDLNEDSWHKDNFVGYVRLIATVPTLTMQELIFVLKTPMSMRDMQILGEEGFVYMGEIVARSEEVDLKSILNNPNNILGMALQAAASEPATKNFNPNEARIRQIMEQRFGEFAEPTEDQYAGEPNPE